MSNVLQFPKKNTNAMETTSSSFNFELNTNTTNMINEFFEEEDFFDSSTIIPLDDHIMLNGLYEEPNIIEQPSLTFNELSEELKINALNSYIQNSPVLKLYQLNNLSKIAHDHLIHSLFSRHEKFNPKNGEYIGLADLVPAEVVLCHYSKIY